MALVICPYCGQKSTLVSGYVIYPHRSDLASKKFYQCQPCDSYVGCHGNTANPLGSLANSELRRAKQAAHATFDPLWRDGSMNRKQAYKWLSNALGVPEKHTHIGMFNSAQCTAVVAAVNERQK